MWIKLFWIGWCTWVTIQGIYVGRQIDWHSPGTMHLGCNRLINKDVICWQYEAI